MAQLSVGRDDRSVVRRSGEQLVIAVADGVGGTGRGAEAAELAMRMVEEWNEDDPVTLIRECDLAIRPSGGETTMVVAVVDSQGVTGASVGDSGAWIVERERHLDLTCRQERIPRVGSGESIPIPFASRAFGTLLLATDGLLSYAPAPRICALIGSGELETLPTRLIDSVRLRSGHLADDATCVVCRWE